MINVLKFKPSLRSIRYIKKKRKKRERQRKKKTKTNKLHRINKLKELIVARDFGGIQQPLLLSTADFKDFQH